MSTILLAEVVATYDYSNDKEFNPPAQLGNDVNVYDFAALAQELRGFKNTSISKSFKDLILKAWGKVVVDPDPSKQGEYCFPNATWLKHRSTVEIISPNTHPGYYEGLWITDYPCAFLGRACVNFQAEMDEEVCLLSLSFSNQTVVLVLINRECEKHLPATAEGSLFAPQDEFRLRLPVVQVPFPFNQFGDYNSHIEHYNQATVDLAVKVNPQYGLAMIGQGDYKTNKMSLMALTPDSLFNKSVAEGSFRSGNVFNSIAHALNEAKNFGLLKLEGKVPDAPPQTDSRLLVTAMSGEVVIDKDDGLSVLLKRHLDITSFAPPFGLDELPEPPGSYIWIGDASGLVYLVDKRNGTQLHYPFEVFDLQAMLENYRKFIKSDKAGSRAILNAARQIKLVQKLFAHQANLVKGLGFHYGAFGLTDSELDELSDGG